jgi:hypothetical protein
MWLMTLAACLAAVWGMHRGLETSRAEVERAKTELQEARDEVQKYRGEMGYLIISDPKKIYARGITTKPDRWSWRVYLPPGHVYEVPVSTVGVPKKGLPSSRNGTMLNLKPGEHTIEAAAEQARDDKWHLHIVISGDLLPNIFDTDMQPHGQDDSRSRQGVFQGIQQAADSATPLVLLRFQSYKTPNGDPTITPPEPCDGLMIWIQEQK